MVLWSPIMAVRDLDSQSILVQGTKLTQCGRSSTRRRHRVSGRPPRNCRRGRGSNDRALRLGDSHQRGYHQSACTRRQGSSRWTTSDLWPWDRRAQWRKASLQGLASRSLAEHGASGDPHGGRVRPDCDSQGAACRRRQGDDVDDTHSSTEYGVLVCCCMCCPEWSESYAISLPSITFTPKVRVNKLSRALDVIPNGRAGWESHVKARHSANQARSPVGRRGNSGSLSGEPR